jgi:hypothetical protein
MPQISTDAAWLLAEAPDDLLAVNVRFGETAELLGIKLDGEALHSDGKLGVRLYWRLQQESDRNGTVFVHLLDGSGQIAAQHDAPPVQGAYPFAIWQRGAVLEDEHILDMDLDNLAPGPYQLAIGVYDPDTLQRWTTENPDGTLSGTGTADIQLPAGVLP